MEENKEARHCEEAQRSNLLTRGTMVRRLLRSPPGLPRNDCAWGAKNCRQSNVVGRLVLIMLFACSLNVNAVEVVTEFSTLDTKDFWTEPEPKPKPKPKIKTTAKAFKITTSFSSRKVGPVPEKTNETEFACSDTVYILVETRGLSRRVHDIELQWIDPTGNRQELTRFSFHVTERETLVWAWLRLHPPENSGLTRTFDPSYGMRTFIGEWSVRIAIDTKPVSTARFDVLC